MPVVAQKGDFPIILERAKSGDTQALDALLEQHLEALRRFVRQKSGRLLRQKESCSDVVQSVCREVLEDLGDLRCDDEPGFRHWLYTLALNKIRHRIEYLTAQKRDALREVAGQDLQSLVGAATPSPSQYLATDEQIKNIEAAIDLLTVEQREVLVQARLIGRSHGEIAASLGKTEAAVRKILSRARARLGLLLDGGRLQSA